MENILVDESYSFSLRAFEKQASKRDLGQNSAGYFEQSRLSNLSAYGQIANQIQNNNGGNLSGRVNNAQSQINSVGKKPSSKVNLLVSSQDFGPFSKRRNHQHPEGAETANQHKRTKNIKQESLFAGTGAEKFSSHNVVQQAGINNDDVVIDSARLEVISDVNSAYQQ